MCLRVCVCSAHTAPPTSRLNIQRGKLVCRFISFSRKKKKEKEVRETVCCVRAHHLPFGISPQIKRKYKQSENVNIATFSTNNRIPRVVRKKKKGEPEKKRKNYLKVNRRRESGKFKSTAIKKKTKFARVERAIPIWWHTTARPHHFHSKQDQYTYYNETQPISSCLLYQL